MGKYDDLLADRGRYDALLSAPKARLGAAVNDALTVNPDDAARTQSLAATAGLPAPVVERNREAVERQVASSRYDRLLQGSPELAEFLSTRENAQVAADDVASLSGLEWMTKAFRAAHAEQWKMIELGTLRSRQLGRDLTPEENARVTQLKSEISGSDFGAENWFEKIVVETGRVLPTMESTSAEAAKTGAITGLGFAGLAAAAGQAGPQVATPEEAITVPAAGMIGMRIGAAAGAMKSAYELEAGLALDEFLEVRGENGEPLDMETARNAAAMVGGVNAALELTGIGAIARYVPGLRRLVTSPGRRAVAAAMKRATFREAARRLATGYAVGVGTEVTTEVLQEATNILGGEIARSLSPGDYKGATAEEVGQRLAEIAIKTTQGMAVLGGVGPGARFVSDAARAQQARRNQAIFEALGQHSTDSKLRARLPARFQEYVARLRERGDIDAVRIPVTEFATYFQTQGLDPAEVARDVTGSDAAYAEAQAAGTDLVIPLEAYATKIAPTDHHAALMPNLRLRPDDMTQREAEQWQEQREALTTELRETDLNAPRQISQPVYDDVLGQLLAAGYEQGAAEQNATLMASVFETLGQRANLDPVELYRKYGLTVERETPAILRNITKFDTSLDPIIDRLRAGQAPTDREIYGPSLSEFLREKGGLRDQGGELAARDVQKSIRGLVKPKGMTFDEAAELAQEAGYLDQRSPDALLAALDRELGGQGAFRPNALNQQLLDLRTTIDDLSQFLSQQGVDVSKADNAAIRELLQSQTTFDQNQLDLFASARVEREPEAKPAADDTTKTAPRSQQGLDFNAPAPEEQKSTATVTEVATAETAPEPAEVDAFVEDPEPEAAGGTEDAGEQLWYNRRNFTGKGVTWGDVEGMNATLRAKEVQKTKIWPRPNYEQLVEDGLEPVAAHLIKQVYDAIPAKPSSTSDANMKLYLEGVAKLRDATIEFVRGLDMNAFGAALEKYANAARGGYAYKERAELGAALGATRDEDRRTSSYPLLDAVFPVPEGTDSRYRFRGDSPAAKANNTLALLLGGNKIVRALSLDGDSAIDAVKAVTQRWPAPQEPCLKRFSIMQTPAGERIYDKGQYRTLDKDEFFIVKKGTRRMLSDGFASRELAIEKAREMTKREGGGKGAGEEKLRVEKAQRVGVERRPAGKNVTSEDLIATFGFRGINFGNWMKGAANEAERQLHLNHAYDAFADLAEILNLPPLAMSLNGMLGIAFGAQGRGGGGGVAHFVPGVNEINLTREGGAGSLAHEWGHALDHYFNNQVGESFAKQADPFLTQTGSLPQAAQGGLRSEILEAFRAITKAMRERDETPEETAKRLAKSKADSLRRLDSWIGFFRKKLDERAKPEGKEAALKKFDAIADKMRAGDAGEYVQAGQGRGMNAYMHKVTADFRELYKDATGRVPVTEELRSLDANVGSMRYTVEQEKAGKAHEPMPVPSQYKRNASALEGGKGGSAYWSTPWEMFARAFESYVLDTLKAKAARNDYLVSSAKDPKVQAAMVSMGLREANPYPEGEERLAINAAFDNLVRNIKTEETEKGVRLYQTFEEARRGSITFGPSRQFKINLLKNRDLSTFLHESGHFYLEVLGDLAEAENAPEQVVQDYAAILKWFGVESRKAITVEHHEKFARGFEAYLFEGKAPNVELQNAFARFRAWLVSIYKKMAALNVELTKEVRGVFDRLVATDEAIAGAEEAQNYIALFADAEAAGMTPEEFAAYRSTVQAARQQAEDDLSRKLLAVQTREQKAWWKERRAEVLKTVTAEVHGQRTYRALSFLRFGQNPDGTEIEGVAPVKLDKAALLKEFGYPQDFLKRLPGAGKSKVYTTEGGVHPDIVAAMFGYRGTDEMITELINARPMKELIAAETDARMRELYPDPMVDGSLAEEAIQSVHSGKRAELLAAELRALNRKRREVETFVRAADKAKAREQRQAREANRAQLPDRDELKLIRAAAERAIAAKRIRDINAATYRVAEARAARAAFAAAEKGDFETAYFEKRKQLLNHELYAAAESAREEADSIRDYFRRFGKRSLRERIGKAQDGAIEKIDALLADVDLVRLSNKAVDLRAVKMGVLEQIENGDLVADEATIAALKQQEKTRNWRELAFEQLVGLRDVIKQLEHQALETTEAIVNGERVKILDATKLVADSILAGNKVVPITVGTRGPGDAAARGAKQALYAWLRPAELARQLDGGNDYGATLRTIIEPIRRAYAEKLMPLEKKIREDVAKLYRQAFTDKELGALHERVDVRELGLTLTRGDLLSLALNWGNEGNRKAVIESRFEGKHIYSPEGVTAALGRLTAKDWQFVQSVWDYIDSYWSQLSAIEKRRRGIAPKKVEAVAFTVMTADGKKANVKGGYYPLKYDPVLSAVQRADDIEGEFKKLTQGRFVSASTRAGATIERVGSGGRAVRLGLGVIDQHLAEVARDISLGDETRFVMRVLNRPELRAAMAKTGNLEALDTLKLWLQDAAVGEMGARDFLSKASAWTRVGFTKAKLAWNLVTTVLQVTGFPQTMVVVGPKALAHGFGKYLSNPVRAHKQIMTLSKFMHSRYETNSWNKDVADTKAYLEQHFVVPTKGARALSALSYSFFWPIARVQMVVDGITWLAGYWKGVNERKLSDVEAVRYADAAVENAQTSGFFVDRSAIERGTLDGLQQRQSQFVKLWTTLISYMLAKGNIAYAKSKAFSRKPTLWGATTLAGDLLMLYAVEAILAGVVRGSMPDDDDDQPWLWWLAKESAASAASGVPFVREIQGAIYGSGNTPLGGLANDFGKALIQSQQGEIDPAMIKAWNNVGGTLFHYPTSQVNRAIDAYWADAVEGEDVSPIEYLTGPRKD